MQNGVMLLNVIYSKNHNWRAEDSIQTLLSTGQVTFILIINIATKGLENLTVAASSCNGLPKIEPREKKID